MSIEKFTTEGLVLAAYDSGESDAVCKIYTRDFGVITAKQSSLKKSVKLRPHIMPHRFTNVTVVKGRELYRIAGARESEMNNHKNKIVPHMSQMVNRFLGFEVKNIKLYDRLSQYITVKDLDVSIVKLCMLADIMITSGYMDTQSIDMNLEEYKASNTDDIYIKVVTSKDQVVKNLRIAIESSML